MQTPITLVAMLTLLEIYFVVNKPRKCAKNEFSSIFLQVNGGSGRDLYGQKTNKYI